MCAMCFLFLFLCVEQKTSLVVCWFKFHRIEQKIGSLSKIYGLRWSNLNDLLFIGYK